MTRAEERRALLKQQSASTNTNAVTNKAQERRKMLGNIQTATMPQTPTQNAFNILNNANKVQSYNDVGTPEAILNKGIALPNRQTYNNANANLLKKEIEKAVNNAQKSKREEELKKMNPIARMNEEIMATIEGKDHYTEEKKERPTLLREHIAGTASLGLTDVYQEQSKKDKSVTAKVYDEYLEKLRNNEKEYVDKLGQENYSKLFEEIYNNSNQKPIDRDFFTQLRLNLGGGNVQGVTNIVNAGAMLANDEFGKNVSEATRWSRDLNKQIMQGNQGKGFGTQVLNASNTVGNVIPTIAGTTVNPILGKVALFGNAAGGAYNEALDNGASLGQAKANAILSGGAELAIESLSGGISNKLLGSKALFNPSNLTKNISNKFVKGGIDFGLEVLGEGIEEVATTALQPVIDRITYNPNATTSGEELWASFRDSILPTLLLQGLGTATIGINNYSENQIKQIQNSNLTQEQKTDLINKTIKQRDKLLNEVQNTEQPAQNVAPQSPNTQIQQQTNEVIPQQIETQQNANLVQNNTQIAQNTPNNEQISQNNVQNVNNSKNIVNENNEETKNIKQESITISQRPTYDIEYKGKKLKAEVRSYSPQNNRYFVKYTMGNGSSNFIELPADVFSNEAKNELSHYIGNINKKEQGLEKTGENFVYHGTLANVKGEDLKASDMGDLGEGLYFAREKEIAEKFSDIGFRNNNLERMRDGRYIDINTGKIFEAGTPHLIEASIDNLNIKQMEPTEWYNAIESLRDKKTNRLPINYETVAQKQFKEQGYDGIELINAGNNNQVVIFPDSIKKIQYNLSNIKDSQQNNSVDEALNRATTNKFSKGKTILGKINDFAKNKIQQLLGIDVSNRQHTLADNDIRHMLNEHGNAEIEAKRGQIPITEADVKRIPSIIDSPDDIVLGSRHQDGQTVRYVKKFEDGINFVVEVVPEKSGALKIKTMWKKPIAVVNSTNTPNLTSKTEGNMINSTSSNNIIQPDENYVNNQNIMPSVEQLQARDLKQGEEISNTLNMKKPKLEDIAELTEEQAQLPTMTYKQRADKDTPYRRKFWDNIESSKIVSKDVKERVTMTNYERKYNEVVLEKMKEKLDTEPMKVAREWFNKDIKKATEQDVALGAILLERYQAEGRIEAAVDVVEKLADMGTEAGRTVQMYSIFQRLTPEGMMMYQQRKLNSALETLTQKQTGKWVEQNKDKFKLTEDDATFITAKVQEAQNAPTERQKQIALAEIENRINDKLPPEAGQSVKAYRRIAMLFNPKTQVRNVVGNITVMPLNYVTDLVGTAIDKAVAKKTGIRTTALPNVKTIGKGFVKGASETIDDYRRGIRTAPTGSRYEIQNNAKSFNENTNSKARNFINNKLNGIDRMLSTVLELGDRPFYEAAYQNALEGQMKANNVTEPTQEMIDIASNVALSQTWQDNNNYTQAVLGIRSAFNKINIKGFGLGDLIIPFAKTPANLTKAMVDYSPAGLISSVINYNDMRKAISRGDMTPMQQKKFVTSVGKAVAGTMLYAIAGALVQSGAVTGSSDEDKDVANFEKNVLGIQPYSIKIGDKTFTYNWAQPLAAPFAIMADTYKMNEENAKWYEILWNAIKVGGDQLIANSFLQGIQDLLSSGYGEDSPMDNLLGTIADLPTQFTPTLFGQVASMFDSTKRQTFEKDDMLATVSNEVKNKLPGAKNTLAPQVNTFGEEIQNYGGENNAFNVFLNPSNISKANATDTQKELYALYEVTKDKTIFPRQAPYSVEGGGEKVTLSSQDRATFQKTSGQYVTENLGALFDSNFYKTLDNDKKVEVVAKIVTDANTTARDIWIDTEATKDLAELKNELKESNIPLIDYYNAWIAQKDEEGEKNIFTGKTKTGTKKQARIKAIDETVGDNLNAWQINKLYDLLN